MADSIEEISKAVGPIFERYNVRYAGLFGSQARGDARPDSDIDILVTLGEKPLSLWDFVGLKNELSKCLKKPVDLLSDRAVVPYFHDYIYRDLKKSMEKDNVAYLLLMRDAQVLVYIENPSGDVA